MNTVLYFTPSGTAYETRAYSTTDIAQLISDHGLQSLTSADRQFDFWFAPSTRGCQRRTNRVATQLLVATTTFTAKNVPLLRGSVVVASHDADGDLDGLSWQQLDTLSAASRSLSKRDDRVLMCRINRDVQRRLRKSAAISATVDRERVQTSGKLHLSSIG